MFCISAGCKNKNKISKLKGCYGIFKGKQRGITVTLTNTGRNACSQKLFLLFCQTI